MIIHWPLLGFELGILCTAIFVLVADLIIPSERKEFLGYAAAIGIAFSTMYHAGFSGGFGSLFGGVFVLDPFSWFFKFIFAMAAFVAVLMSWHYVERLERGRGEFFLLLLLSTLGMGLLVSARDFLLLFVALELMTISFYVMTAYLRMEPTSVEAGLKYLILGGLASATLVMGMAFLYGATGSTQFADIQKSTNILSPLATLGFLFVAAALLFKVAAFPFHFWVPDVYEGAPTPVSAFLSVGSKAAAFGVFVRILVEAVPGVDNVLLMILSGLAALTVVYGNLVAMPQTNTKRLLAYSSIGHAGYLLMGLATGSALGLQGIVFYLLAYAFANLGAWLVFFLVEENTGDAGLVSFAGLSKRSPLLAAVMFVSLLSLAGAPPLAGFFGKFVILLSVVQRGYLWLAIIGAMMIIVSLYYYLLVVKRMYLEEPKDQAPFPVTLAMRVVMVVLVIGTVGMGIYQEPFLTSAQAAVRALFGG